MKKNTTAFIVLMLIIIGGIGAYYWSQRSANTVMVGNTPANVVSPTPQEIVTTEVASTTSVADSAETVLGKSVEGRNVTAFHYGTGDKEVLFVGGIHGGYEWNTALVAYELMDYLQANPMTIPANVRVTVIPVLNPDGLHKVISTTERFTKANVPTPVAKTIPGRFNANNVDLNRNFDCDWQATGKWQNKPVSGGSAVFSEPESQAFKSYVESRKLSGVVVWFSSAGGVYSSNCHNDVSPETAAITKIYADASGYPSYKVFNYYEITGDIANWLAKKNIPAISVLLSTHEDAEWSKNKAGVEALLAHYAK